MPNQPIDSPLIKLVQAKLDQHNKRHFCAHDLDQEEWGQLKAIAALNHESIYAFVSRVLREQLEKEQG